MSVRGNPDGTATPLVGDGNAVPTPNAQPYAEHDPKTVGQPIKIYDTHAGRPRHVPLCESSKTDLHRAVVDKNPGKMADLLDDPGMKAKIDHQDMFGFTALHMTCQTTTTGTKRGQKDPEVIECARLLIENGADINIHTTDEQWAYTPLHFAVSSLYPQVEICQMLLAKGVDLCAVDVYGNTPLHNAALGTHTEQLRVLTKHPDWAKAIAVQNKKGETALQLAKEKRAAQEKKVEKAPCHDETVMLLETGKGLEQIVDEPSKKKKAAASG